MTMAIIMAMPKPTTYVFVIGAGVGVGAGVAGGASSTPMRVHLNSNPKNMKLLFFLGILVRKIYLGA
jgi:hypothetical protein